VSLHALRLSEASNGLKKSSRPPSLNESFKNDVAKGGARVEMSTRTLAERCRKPASLEMRVIHSSGTNRATGGEQDSSM